MKFRAAPVLVAIAVAIAATVAACSSGDGSTSTSIRTVPNPVIRTIIPATVCQRALQVVSLGGDEFISPSLYLDGRSFMSSQCVPATRDSSCLSFDLGYDDLSIGPHTVEVETSSTPRIRSDPSTINVVSGPPFPGQPAPDLVYASGHRTVFVPTSNVTGRIMSARLNDLAGVILPVEFSEVVGGIQITVPATAGEGVYRIELSDESPCVGRDPASSALRTTDTPVLLLRDFETQDGAAFDRTVAVTGEPGPLLAWLKDQGNPGSAIGANRDASGPDWYLVALAAWGARMDIGLIRFDLRSSGAGEPSAAPGVVITNIAFQLEHAIPPPPNGSWAHYELSLQTADGWTYRDANGSRPAEPADLQMSFLDVRVLGSWWRGAGSATVDNLAVELAR